MKKLLIIENNERFAAGLVRSLSRRGFSCMISATTADARELAESFQPDCVLMDLNLENETTQSFVVPLRKICPQATIVVLTGFGTIPSAVQAMRDGANSYLTKPASPEAIEKSLLESTNDKTDSLSDVENNHILKTLEKCGGNITQTAKELGLHRRTLQRRLKQL